MQAFQVRNGGIALVERSCGENLLFNPVRMVCDFDYNVVMIRPECQTIPSQNHAALIAGEAIPDIPVVQEDIFDLLESAAVKQEVGSGYEEEVFKQLSISNNDFSQMAQTLSSVQASLDIDMKYGMSNNEVNNLTSNYFKQERDSFSNVLDSLNRIGDNYDKSGKLHKNDIEELKTLVNTNKEKRTDVARLLATLLETHYGN